MSKQSYTYSLTHGIVIILTIAMVTISLAADNIGGAALAVATWLMYALYPKLTEVDWNDAANNRYPVLCTEKVKELTTKYLTIATILIIASWGVLITKIVPNVNITLTILYMASLTYLMDSMIRQVMGKLEELRELTGVRY